MPKRITNGRLDARPIGPYGYPHPSTTNLRLIDSDVIGCAERFPFRTVTKRPYPPTHLLGDFLHHAEIAELNTPRSEQRQAGIDVLGGE